MTKRFSKSTLNDRNIDERPEVTIGVDAGPDKTGFVGHIEEVSEEEATAFAKSGEDTEYKYAR